MLYYHYYNLTHNVHENENAPRIINTQHKNINNNIL
jgi:hypothetical protein